MRNGVVPEEEGGGEKGGKKEPERKNDWKMYLVQDLQGKLGDGFGPEKRRRAVQVVFLFPGENKALRFICTEEQAPACTDARREKERKMRRAG